MITSKSIEQTTQMAARNMRIYAQRAHIDPQMDRGKYAPETVISKRKSYPHNL